MTKFRLGNPCQNKESKQKKHDDKRDKRNAIEVWCNIEFICFGLIRVV